MIYIAAPYYHPDKTVINQRMELVHGYMASLMRDGYHCVSPMLFHEIVNKYELPNDFSFWGAHSLDLLSRCDSMTVIMLDGWRESRGVSEEIRYCTENNKEVKYV